MNSRLKRLTARLSLCLALGIAAGALTHDADAARCRVQHCWDFWILQYCYWDSGPFDC
jgi:hypothetical protein